MNQDSRYKDALTNSMTFLGEQSDTVFIGQQTLFPGNPMSTTLGNVLKNKIIELPSNGRFSNGYVLRYGDDW